MPILSTLLTVIIPPALLVAAVALAILMNSASATAHLVPVRLPRSAVRGADRLR